MTAIMLLLGQSLAILERSALSIVEYDSDGQTKTKVTYSGTMKDRFSILRNNTYWAPGCVDNWRNPQDVFFTTVVPQGKVRILEYNWSSPVTVSEVFLMLTTDSQKDSQNVDMKI